MLDKDGKALLSMQHSTQSLQSGPSAQYGLQSVLTVLMMTYVCSIGTDKMQQTEKDMYISSKVLFVRMQVHNTSELWAGVADT